MIEINYEVEAKKIMQYIQLDNGYGHFEGVSYPEEWVTKIAHYLKVFFKFNPDKFSDQDIENISRGCDEEDQEIYNDLRGWDNLNKILNEYFNDGMSVGLVEEKPRLIHTYSEYKGIK